MPNHYAEEDGPTNFFVLINNTPSITPPPKPDFTISAAPAAQTVLAGAAATLDVTLTATGGFKNSVSLKCTNLPAGAVCSFNPSAITPSASGSQTTLTVTTAPNLAQANYTLTIGAASGSTTHTQDIHVAVGGLSGSVTPSSATIAVGSSADFTVNVSSSGGFAGPVTLACGGLPAGLTCAFHPAQVTVTANATASSKLTVNVSSKPSSLIAPSAPRNAPPPPSRSLPLMAAGHALLTLALLLGVVLSGLTLLHAKRGLQTTPWRSPSVAALGSFAFALVLAITLISCSGATCSS